MREHRAGEVPGFTQAYRVHRLVYYEEYGDVRDALRREKQLKGWRNPDWADLAAR